MDEEIELTPDTGEPSQAKIAYDILQVLENNKKAAYHVYIVLCKQFGSGKTYE